MMESVSSWHEVYLGRSNLRPASVEIKRRVCSFFCEAFGDPPIGRVTAAMAEDFRTLLGRGRTAVSVNGYVNNFRPFWSWCFRHGTITANPFAHIGPLTIEEEPPKETFRPAELARLMRIADPFWRVRICLGLMGCRRGEMLHVQGRDCHLEAAQGHILIGYHRPDAETIQWGVKGHKLRYVGVPERMGFDGVIVPLRRLVAERIAEVGEAGYVCLERKYVRKLLGMQAAGGLTTTPSSGAEPSVEREASRG